MQPSPEEMVTVDQATRFLNLEQSAEIHWSLGNALAARWRSLGHHSHYELRPHTFAPELPPHFKRVYPFAFAIAAVRELHSTAALQLDLFGEIQI